MMRSAVLASLLTVAVCAEDPVAQRTSFDERNASLCVVPGSARAGPEPTVAPCHRLSALSVAGGPAGTLASVRYSTLPAKTTPVAT